MTVGELKALLDDYGDHIEVVAVDDEAVSHVISDVRPGQYDGMAACAIEFD